MCAAKKVYYTQLPRREVLDILEDVHWFSVETLDEFVGYLANCSSIEDLDGFMSTLEYDLDLDIEYTDPPNNFKGEGLAYNDSWDALYDAWSVVFLTMNRFFATYPAYVDWEYPVVGDLYPVTIEEE